ncbi:Coenzyme Q-binding protein coq10, mitochondrial [Teratosphaeriaceae sp. CCFEE 6253]|nr:Coenzyme Q-binding protein coq10, mitochondrial [Teratosphaeriaceae sp. CCFEE 6253]
MQSLRPSATAILQSSTRPPLTCRTATAFPPRQRTQQPRRDFTNPFAGPQSLLATRTLNFPSKVVYEVISDVASYSTFLPYCQSSTVTKRSKPARDGKTYPEEAQLVIGFNGGDVTESFTSRVYCIPERIVEAVSGRTDTNIGPEEVPHHSARAEGGEADASRKDTVMSHLLTRWTLNSYPYKPPPGSAVHPDSTHDNHKETSELPSQEKTDVTLAIEFQFANPVYAALSSAAAPRVAEKMIDAFERRVQSIMHGPFSVEQKTSPLDGILRLKR